MKLTDKQKSYENSKYINKIKVQNYKNNTYYSISKNIDEKRN